MWRIFRHVNTEDKLEVFYALTYNNNQSDLNLNGLSEALRMKPVKVSNITRELADCGLIIAERIEGRSLVYRATQKGKRLIDFIMKEENYG